VSDTVRLRPTEALIDLDVLVNDLFDPAARAPDWPAFEPRMDNRMDSIGDDLSRIAADQAFFVPPEGFEPSHTV
jgi:hypothetical protein